MTNQVPLVSVVVRFGDSHFFSTHKQDCVLRYSSFSQQCTDLSHFPLPPTSHLPYTAIHFSKNLDRHLKIVSFSFGKHSIHQCCVCTKMSHFLFYFFCLQPDSSAQTSIQKYLFAVGKDTPLFSVFSFLYFFFKILFCDIISKKYQ